MKKYFYAIGIIEIIAFIVLFITFLVSGISGLVALAQARQLNGLSVFTFIIETVILLVVGPALGLLFISHSNQLPEIEYVSSSYAAAQMSNKELQKKKAYEDFTSGRISKDEYNRRLIEISKR